MEAYSSSLPKLNWKTLKLAQYGLLTQLCSCISLVGLPCSFLTVCVCVSPFCHLLFHIFPLQWKDSPVRWFTTQSLFTTSFCLSYDPWLLFKNPEEKVSAPLWRPPFKRLPKSTTKPAFFLLNFMSCLCWQWQQQDYLPSISLGTLIMGVNLYFCRVELLKLIALAIIHKFKIQLYQDD